MKCTKLCSLILVIILTSFSVFAEDNYEKALESFTKDDIKTSYIHLKNSLNETPEHLPSKILMGKVLFRLGYIREATIEFEEALEMGADEELILVPLAQAYLALEEYKNVIDMDVRRLNDKNTFGYLLVLGSAYGQLKQVDAAKQTFEKAYKLYPDSIKATLSLAHFYLSVKNFQRSDQLIKKAEGYGTSAASLYARGQWHLAQKDQKQALKAFELAYHTRPNDPVISRAYSDLLLLQRDYDTAKPILEAILERTPDDPYAQLSYGRLIGNTGNTSEANAVFEELSSMLTLLPPEVRATQQQLILLKGVASYYKGDYLSAMLELEQFVASNPNHKNAMALLARIYLTNDFLDKAVNLLDSKKHLISDDLVLSLVLCDLYLASNKAHKCINVVDTMYKKFGDNPAIQVMEVKLLQKRGRTEEAVDKFELYFTDNDDPYILELAANIHAQNGDLKKALIFINKAIATLDNDDNLKKVKLRILVSLGEYTEAKALFSNLYEANELSTEAKLTLIEITLGEGTDIKLAENLARQLLAEDDKSPVAMRLLGQALMAQGNLDEAIEVTLGAKFIDKDDLVANEMLVQIYESQGKYSLAISELDALLGKAFLDPDYLFKKAELYEKQDNIEAAQQQYNIIFSALSEDSNRLLQLARRQLRLADFEGTEKSLTKAKSLNSDNLEIDIDLVRLFIAQNDLNRARTTLIPLLKEYTQNATLTLLSGDIDLAAKNLKTAQQKFKKALTLDPNYKLAAVRLYNLALNGINGEEFEKLAEERAKNALDTVFFKYLLANYYIETFQYNEAADYYSQIYNLPRIPNRISILNNYANALAAIGDTERAEKVINIALNLSNNTDAYVLGTKGWLFILAEKYNEALETLRRSHALDSTQPTINYRIALSLQKLKRTDEALEYLELALSDTSNFEQKNDALRLAEELRKQMQK